MKAEKGPADLRDLPEYFGERRPSPGLRGLRHPHLRRDQQRPLPHAGGGPAPGASHFQASGADVIDLGCSLERKFTDAPEVIEILKAPGPRRQHRHVRQGRDPGRRPGRGRLRAERERRNLDLAGDLHCTVVVIPDFGQGLETLDRNIAHLEQVGRPYIVDPVIEPITQRVRGVPRPLRAGPRALPRGRDAHGHRQHHRADRGRQHRASTRCSSASARSSGSGTSSPPRSSRGRAVRCARWTWPAA